MNDQIIKSPENFSVCHRPPFPFLQALKTLAIQNCRSPNLIVGRVTGYIDGITFVQAHCLAISKLQFEPTFQHVDELTFALVEMPARRLGQSVTCGCPLYPYAALAGVRDTQIGVFGRMPVGLRHSWGQICVKRRNSRRRTFWWRLKLGLSSLPSCFGCLICNCLTK